MTNKDKSTYWKRFKSKIIRVLPPLFKRREPLKTQGFRTNLLIF